MGDYKNIIKKLLSESDNRYKSSLYHEGINEVMSPEIEEAIYKRQHSLSECGVFPESEIPFDIILIGDRFKDVVLNGREAFDVNHVDPNDMYMHINHLFEETIEMEKSNKKALEELAIKIITEEFEIPEGAIEFDAKLTESIDKPTEESKKDKSEIIFEDHDELVNGNNEIKKRRAINALMAGAAKNIDHLYHEYRDLLKDLNTKLLINYKKLLAADEFLSYVMSNNEDELEVGVYNVMFETKKDIITPKVTVRAMAFPIMLAELYKGVMEVLSTHGLPKSKKLLEYAMDHADYTETKKWDDKLGPKMWECFYNNIPKSDRHLKHLVFAKFISTPPVEFMHNLREVLGKTKSGKDIIMEVINEVKKELKVDEFINELNDTHFNYDDFE